MRPNRTMTRMSKYGIELYSTLEPRPGWRPAGSSAGASTSPDARADAGPAQGSRSRAASASMQEWTQRGGASCSMRTDDLAGAISMQGDGEAIPAPTCVIAGQGSADARREDRRKRLRSTSRPQHGPTSGARHHRAPRRRRGRIPARVHHTTAPASGPGGARSQRGRARRAEHLLHRHRPHRGHSIPMLPVLRRSNGYIYYKEKIDHLLMEPSAEGRAVDRRPDPASSS